MKKTCNGCAAFQFDYTCDLGYKINKKENPFNEMFGSVLKTKAYSGIPQEDCPKPLTYKKYLELKKTT